MNVMILSYAFNIHFNLIVQTYSDIIHTTFK